MNMKMVSFTLFILLIDWLNSSSINNAQSFILQYSFTKNRLHSNSATFKATSSLHERLSSNDEQNTPSTSRTKRTVIRPRKPQLQVNTEATNDSVSNYRTNQLVTDPTIFTNQNFAQHDLLHPLTKRALTETLHLTSMTQIQSKTFHPILQGKDIIATAPTGTGKTIAFLLPTIEKLLQNYHLVEKGIPILIISPTRELAAQIATQAERLLTHHQSSTIQKSRQNSAPWKVQVMYGGTKINRDVYYLNKQLPTILVSTPGRLLEHLQNTKLDNGRKFGYDLMAKDLNILILDEMDKLLNMGFGKDIDLILKYLPIKDKRQTLLFSATYPKSLKISVANILKPDYETIDCSSVSKISSLGSVGSEQQSNKRGKNDQQVIGTSELKSQIEQKYLILPTIDLYVSSLHYIIQHLTAERDAGSNYKIIVFFPTARMVSYFADFFNIGLGIDVLEIHSKKSQGHRTRVSEIFRNADNAILFTSDVSARGMDYPDVSYVIQYGLPESRTQYIHRLGRTGRAGRSGKALLVLAPFESKFVRDELKGLNIQVDNQILDILKGSISINDSKVSNILNRVRSGDHELTPSARLAYQAFLGYYSENLKRTDNIRSKGELVQVANHIAKLMGLHEIPQLTERVIQKMRLDGTPGIHTDAES